MDFDESLDYAVDKRKFLIRRLADEAEEIKKEEDEEETIDEE